MGGSLAELMGMQRRALGVHTPPGDESQITVEAVQVDEKGRPLVIVADGKVVKGETAAWLAIARLQVGGQQERTWGWKRRKRKPIIIGR